MGNEEWSLVTGSGRGIGEAIALRLARRGDHVVLAALEEDELRAVSQKIEAMGVKSLQIPYDARSEDSVAKLFAKLDAEGIVPKRVVCNAGVYSGLRLLRDLSVDEFDEVMRVNVRGTFLCCREAIRRLSGIGGAIVIVSSSLGKKSLPAMGAYCASKAALNSLTRTLALENAPAVRVNSVCPGPVQTTMTAIGFPKVAEALGIDMAALQSELMRGFPLRRIATVDDVAGLATFLLSEEAVNLTGQCVNTDAGWLMET